MRNIIFLDTEATGNVPATDRLCQVCYQVRGGETRVGYFKPPIPISVKAMSITHITNKMVEAKEAFADSQFKKDLQALLNEGVLVAHTALFDIAMLKAEGMEIPRFIDTLRVVRHLDPEMKIPEHNLQYLRYFLELEVPGAAHDAEGDVNVLVALYERLFKKMKDLTQPSPSLGEGGHEVRVRSDEDVINEMIAISARPTLFKYMVFGKYKGKPLAELVQSDRRYLEWLLGSMTSNGEADTDEDLIYTLKHYLQV